jgi:hypothetical protein
MQKKYRFILAYVLFGLIVGFLVWQRLLVEDISRCGKVATCELQYTFIFPFSIVAWPVVSLAVVMWEPAGFVAFIGVLALMMLHVRNKKKLVCS